MVKYLRCRAELGEVSSIAREARALAALQAAGVTRVPQLVVPDAPHVVCAEGGRQVLLLRPVGEPLRRLVSVCATH